MKDSINKLQLTTWIVMVGMFYVLYENNIGVLYIGLGQDELSPNDWLIYMVVLSTFTIFNITLNNPINRVIVLLATPMMFVVLINMIKHFWLAWFFDFPFLSLCQIYFCLSCYTLLIAHIYSLGFKADSLIFFSIILVIGLTPISKQLVLLILKNSNLI